MREQFAPKMGIILYVLVVYLCDIFIGGGHALTRDRPLPDQRSGSKRGLYPNVFNVAANAKIEANATCGTRGDEVYCQLEEFGSKGECGVCNAHSPDPLKRHPIENAIDGTDSWWQSLSLQYGNKYEWVTIVLDLKQVFQVSYVIVKAGISPRPGNWILERSLDGASYKPWQYFAANPSECFDRYGLEASGRRPVYESDSAVICVSHFSDLVPMKYGEIHISLVKGRPGASEISEELLEFTKARFVRLRLQGLQTLPPDMLTIRKTDLRRIDPSVTRRYFYSIKDISIGGQCLCYGHGKECVNSPDTGVYSCKCSHNTCGDQCEVCCPLYNQQPWTQANKTGVRECRECQCYGHASECYYDVETDRLNKSIDIDGNYNGGGVCVDCKNNTRGINCEQCKEGYYRPRGGSGMDKRQQCIPCNCDEVGSTGECYSGTLEDESRVPGQCECQPGFGGLLCNQCARGFGQYPNCKPCTCNVAGTVGSNCEGRCNCKENVLGDTCDMCRPGFFLLDIDNPSGCTECFCYGISTNCKEREINLTRIESLDHWKISNLQGTRVVTAQRSKKGIYVTDDEMPGFDSYYWMAPPEYLGNRLTSYGTTVKFTTSWVKARGDISGRLTKGPDVILEGSGMKIGYGDGTHKNHRITLKALLNERDWYFIHSGISDFNRDTEHLPRVNVGRTQFMLILGSLDRLLVRAKFHTDQVEARLQESAVEVGAETTEETQATTIIEECYCPPGYTGHSCEQCAFGYRRINNTLYQGECRKCDCNGHVDTCDPVTGMCHNCLHNTEGDKCERCVEGYVGDARGGTPKDCVPCPCPHVDGASCVTLQGGLDYYCKSCPEGFSGNKCDKCTNGYYGGLIGSYGRSCTPCDCNGNLDLSHPLACDPITGECLHCRDQSSGPRCEICVGGYYGDPVTGRCQACNCNQYGATDTVCDRRTGQCSCKAQYSGLRCDLCKDEYGRLSSGCKRCDCSPVGAESSECDSSTAQCVCRSGVEGLNCDRCKELHYGFSKDGCKSCGCNRSGSRDSRCDIVTGQCSCWPHVTARTCDRCEMGYFLLKSGVGCEKCDCDLMGSLDGSCDQSSGQCLCKSGVGGKRCDSCKFGFFDFSEQGCRACDPCDKPGHICDPDTGRCVCPTMTQGGKCEMCRNNAYGYHPNHGCKPCNCAPQGSIGGSCDPVTGQCRCREGYIGLRCEKCAHGFFDFPSCKSCRCKVEGTDPQACDDKGVCQCDKNGQCPCKVNVQGKRCGRCRNGTYGLQEQNKDGCIPCFCFERSQTCDQAEYKWTQLVAWGDRHLKISYSLPRKEVTEFKPWNTREICYLNLASPERRDIVVGRGTQDLVMVDSLAVIPGVTGDVNLSIGYTFDSPIYWKLPPQFLGDRILSYNGYLRFRVSSHGGNIPFPQNILKTYPLVQMRGNEKVVLEYFPEHTSKDGYYRVRLHEDHWRDKGDPSSPVSRPKFMICLQNVQDILVRASHASDLSRARLNDVSLSTAIPRNTKDPLARGIERCSCSAKYNGTSCQDPSQGYYRYKKPNYLLSPHLIDLVGEATPCQCNGRTNICFKEDGHCIGCDANTIGHNCEFCKAGYYGNPAAGGCRVCQCPTAEYNYAMSCSISYGEMSCACKDGYSGKRCENCAPGYYGNVMKGGCKPCHCERLGSINDFCDAESGQCYCKPGISGRDCTQCAPRHVVSEAGCRSCDEGCSGVLLRDFHYMDHKLKRLNLTDTSAAGWRYLAHIRNQTHHLRTDLTHYTNTKAQLSTLVDDYYFDSSLRRLQGRARQNNLESQTAVINSRTILRQCEELSVTSHNLRRNIEDTVGDLLNYAIGETPSVNIGRALQTAEAIHKELRRRNFDLERANVEEHLRLVQELLDRIRGMGDDSVVIASQKRKLNETERLIRDHQEHLRVVAGDNENTASMLREGAQMLAKARKAEEMLASGKDRILEKITSGEDTLGLAVSHLNDATMLYQDVRDWLHKLDHPIKRMRDRYDLQSEVLSEYENRYITPARHHAESLARRAQNLFDLFNRTRDVADLPLRAAQAYKNIVEALRKARKAAEEASHVADRAYIEVHPFDGRSLIHDSHSSRDQAQQLLDMTVSLRPREASLKNGLQDHQDEFRDLELEVRGIQQSFQQLLNTLEGISTERRNLFPDVMNKISEVVRMIEVERSRYLRIEELIRVVLMIRWQEFRSDFDVDYTSMLKMVINSMMELERAKTISEKLFVRREEILEYSEKVEWKFSNIRKKILKSRHMASTIRVSLAGHQGNCRRSYRVRTQSTTTSSIQIIYSSSSSHDDSLLFYLSSYQNLSDFMAVEMLDRRIRFHWDNGGGTKSITNPTRIDYSDDALLNDDKWYLIRASRIGNIGKLLVHPMRKTEDGEEVEGVSPQGYNILDVPEISQVYVGGVPDDPSPTVLARGFYGCMSQVSLDDQMVSLWNFISNRECSACIEGPAFRVEEYTFTFNGEGYAEIPQDFLYDTEKYGVSFNFKTLDENALLFLAISKDNTQFFSVELRNGQVFFQMFGPKKKVFMITKEKYNTGNWTSLRADWVYFPRREKGALTVENEVYYSDFTDFGPLDLSESSVFFGGVPPDFDSARLPDINMQSFLGCMNTLQIKQVEQNPVSGNYYGVEQGCQPHGLRSVGFSGDGYLEMKSEPLKSKANFGCSFRSSQTDALLLLSTCQRQGDVQNYFSLSLADGRLSVKVSNNDETVSLGSPPGYNDGAFHNIVVMKNEREISLLVDDRKVDSRRSGRDMVINASSHGGLYFGGIPNYLSVRNQVASTESLRGCIRNVVLNDRLFYLDEPVSFSHAGFGRCKQPLRKSVSLEDSLLSDGEPKMCARPSAYEVDGVAVKFGDHPHSYVRIPIKKKGLSNHFNISIDFRTYYPNGMLLLTFEEKNDKVFLLSIALQDGRLTFTLKAKRKLLMKSTAPLNDGKWHNIFIEKRGPKYVLNIDGVKKKNGRGPKKFKSGNGVFVGGLPPEDFDLPAYITEETFKGCIRGLTINGRTFDLSGGHTEVSNVGQCFSNVEPGSYFSGDSYAIYSKQFRIGALLELELQFRTSAMNGILVSVSEPKGYPALGLEITNGAVVMGVNIGNGHVFRANQTFNTPFRVCDNRWHSVKATYVKNSITLRVDQYDEQYGFTDNGELQQSLTNSPLYIGGLPEGANLGVLTVRDNFKGCIRNVVIQNQRKDWTDMEKLNNVKLNSCPAE